MLKNAFQDNSLVKANVRKVLAYSVDSAKGFLHSAMRHGVQNTIEHLRDPSVNLPVSLTGINANWTLTHLMSHQALLLPRVNVEQ